MLPGVMAGSPQLGTCLMNGKRVIRNTAHAFTNPI